MRLEPIATEVIKQNNGICSDYLEIISYPLITIYSDLKDQTNFEYLLKTIPDVILLKSYDGRYNEMYIHLCIHRDSDHIDLSLKLLNLILNDENLDPEIYYEKVRDRK